MARKLRDLDVLLPSIAEGQAVAALNIALPPEDEAGLVGMGQEIAIGSGDFPERRRCRNRTPWAFGSHRAVVSFVPVSPVVSITEARTAPGSRMVM
jgi:hypothetical protein